MATRNPERQLTVIVRDAISGDILPLPQYSFIVNEDNVGDPQVDLSTSLRDPSKYPSLQPGNSHSPVVAAGAASPTQQPVVTVLEGKYIVSVLAEGYKIGGNWIDVSGEDKTLEVFLQPHPLPLSKIRVHVFHDNNPVNGEDDFPLESGLPEFLVVIADAIGEVTVDCFGNPLGTQYQRDQNGNLVIDPTTGDPIAIPNTGGKIITDANGDAVIENLPPGKYGVQAIPPDGSDWIQTTTIEGTHVIDAWIEEGNDGYSPREGFKASLVWIGFVRPKEFPPQMPWQAGQIKGRTMTVIEFVPPFRPLLLGEPIDRPWVALSDIGGNDQQVYMGRGDNNGNFVIKNVPPGIYQMAIWDEPLDYIISFRTVQVQPGETVDMGDIGVPRWYGYIKGTVFNDKNGNGILDPGEEGIPNVEVGTRFKDGSIQYSTVTDMHGKYLLDEVFELERFAVAEVGFTRLDRTGATGAPDDGIPVTYPSGCLDRRGRQGRCPETYPDVLTLAELTWAAKTNRIDWGKRVYEPGKNGGLSGIVYYATMRNEIDPQYSIAENYEPGVPDVLLKLYATEVSPLTGEIIQGQLINMVTTDAWKHPTGCKDADGSEVTCFEVPGISNQIQPGVFDGGYAFETYFSPYYGAPGAIEQPLFTGTYIVEVVLPPGYRILDENSINTDDGDVFEMPNSRTAALVNTDAGIEPSCSYRITNPPYYQDSRTKKLVDVREGLNAVADFFIYTDVPVPGRIVGFLLDDVNIETDPNFIYYGEKRGIPDTPVGIRDYTGRLITTVHSDINGIFEVLLPSTYTGNVPTPSGVAPGMYRVIGNDPGDPDRPNKNYNPAYQTLNLVFDVWPGKTTYADVALFPISAFVAKPGAQFSQPPRCDIPPGTPKIFRVDRVHIEPGGIRTVAITGRDFGMNQGRVTVDGSDMPVTNWTDIQIIVDIPVMSGGAKELLVVTGVGKVSPYGITLHILDDTYNPTVISVPSSTYPTIQSAIDGADDDTLIVVSPGTYYESPIIYKNVKLQGMGAHDTVIDGRYFLSYKNDWLAKLAAVDFDGPELVPPDQVKEISRGQVITIVSRSGAFGPLFRPQLDGFTITGARGEEGGGIFINAHCHYLVISNNIIRSNGGGFGGGITIGKAYVGDNYNQDILIHRNRIVNNGGISLAGGIGIFNGAHNYEIRHNEICGNYSAEYGGGISHFGLSDGGKIHHNTIFFNASFDEGAGVLIGGQQPVPPEVLTAGSGKVDIYNNLVQGNVANDDGGGVRLLQPRDYLINIFNNMIVNNVSTDLGGGIALDDASNVVIFNNTIAKNITTATAEDSDGTPHAAGLVSEPHSAAFRITLPPNAAEFSNPVLFNNIFWDNCAGVFDQTMNGGRGGIGGIGADGDPGPVRVIDLEVFGLPVYLYPEHCSISIPYPGGSNNLVGAPVFAAEYDTQLTAVAFNMEPDFKSVKIVTVQPTLEGDYHLSSASTLVIDQGISQVTRIVNGETFNYRAPGFDFDDQPRPRGEEYDMGADEF